MKSFPRPSLSTVLVAIFFLILMFLGLFAEVFESQTPEVDLAQIYANPVPISELSLIKTLRLTNKHGNFLFENTNPDGHLSGPWQMIEPQSLKVKNNVIQKIVNALANLRVRNFHRLEPINISSFSLDNPTLTLDFVNSKNKSLGIKMGLINPIDNSAYMTLTSQNQIYQIDPLEITLETYDLAQLAESKVLVLNTDSLASLEIYGQSQLTLKLVRREEFWFDQNGTQLNDAKVKRFFDKLEDLKSVTILDNLSNEQKDYFSRSMANPFYSLKIISTQGVRSYLIGNAENIPNMPNTEGKYALSSDDKQSFILIEKDQIKVLSTKLKELK